MPADASIVSLRSETAERPAARRDAPREESRRRPEQPMPPPRQQPERPIERSTALKKTPGPPRRRRSRWALFALLPLALLAGGYSYVSGGRVMSTDNAYVEADKVSISTDVSGIVKQIEVVNNQQVEAGQVLFRLDDLPFRLALERAKAQVGNSANYVRVRRFHPGSIRIPAPECRAAILAGRYPSPRSITHRWLQTPRCSDKWVARPQKVYRSERRDLPIA